MKLINEVTVSIALVLLLAVFLDPIMVFMPSRGVYIAMAGVVVIFAVLAGLVWRERPLDERDELHRMFAGRIGYLAGSVILLIGILTEGASGHVDPWLVYGLGAMVLGKLAGLLWSRKFR